MTSFDLDLMDVEERRKLLSAYLDGELSTEHALIVSQWLDANPGALREVEHLRHLWDLLEHYEDEPVPEDFASGVIRSVGISHVSPQDARPEGGRVIQMAWYRRPMATAAAVLLAIGATALVMSNRGTSPAVVEPATTVSELEALGVEDLVSLEYLDVIVDADDATFDALVADGGSSFGDGGR